MESPIEFDWNIQENYQFTDLETEYLAWADVNKKHLDVIYSLIKDQKEPSKKEKDEADKIKDARERLFSVFLSNFSKKLPEIWKMLTVDHSRSLNVDIAGVSRPFISQLVDAAFEHKVHARIVSKKLEFFCSQNTSLSKVDLSTIAPNDLEMVGLTKSGGDKQENEEEDLEHQCERQTDPNKITKEMIAEFCEVPDPITKASVTEIVPSKETLLFKIKEPDSYNNPITNYCLNIVVSRSTGDTTTIESTLECSNLSLVLPDLASIRTLEIEIRAENKMGRQDKPYLLKLQFGPQYSDIWMFGRNDVNQIDYQLVDEKAQATIDANEKEDNFCNQWGKLSLESLKISDLKLASVVCKSTTLAVVNNSELVQWGATLSEEGGKVNAIPAGMFLRNKLLVKTVSVGNAFCIASSIVGEVFTWGDNRVGQLGQGTFSNLVEHPTLVAALEGHFITDVKAGYGHCLCLSDKGVAFSWGWKQAMIGEPVLNRFGDHISLQNTGVHQHTPQDISSRYTDKSETVRDIESGEFHMGVITSKGKLFLWGENEEGMFGDYPAANSVVPIPINLPKPVKKVSLGFSHNIVEVEDQDPGSSSYLAWGSNDHMQCGLSVTKFIKEPTKIPAFDKFSISFFSCGVDRTYFVTEEKDLYVLGKKFKGLTKEDSSKPVKVKSELKEARELNGTIVAMN